MRASRTFRESLDDSQTWARSVTFWTSGSKGSLSIRLVANEPIVRWAAGDLSMSPSSTQ